jgi:prepilin peptidase CpaA
MLSSIIVPSHALLAAVLLAAVVTDIRSRRIPNKLVLCGIAVALVVHAIAMSTGTPSPAGRTWWAPLAGMATGFALLLPLHLVHAMGAGDIKLMAMVGAFVGSTTMLDVALYTFVAGGVLALVFMLVRGVAAQTLANVRFMLTDLAHRASTGQGARLAPLQVTAAPLPYAIAIALGTGAAIAWPLTRSLNGVIG